jgi:hypothetical protein
MASEIVPFIDKDQLATMREFVDYLKTNSALPANENAGQVMMKLQAAKDMGLTPTQALTGIAFVNGKLAVFGAAAASLMVKHGYNLAWGKCSATTATLKVSKEGRGEHSETFTIDDAKKAGLAGKAGPWTLYTRDMLRWKALARARNFFCPEVGGGLPIKEDYQETEKELLHAESGKIEEAQDNAKAAIEDAKKRRKAAKAIAHEATFEPEAKAFEDEAAPAVGVNMAAEVESEVATVTEIWAAWLDERLPKNVLENRRANELELFRFLNATLGTQVRDMGALSAEDKAKSLAAIHERNDGMLTEKPETLLASQAQVSALAKAMGGETWFKKAMRRKFGHDNAYALTAEQADALKADLHPSGVQAVEKTLAEVAEKEKAQGDAAKGSTVDRIRAAWAEPSLHASALAIRTLATLESALKAKVRPDATLDNLTPTEAETFLSLVLERNATAPKA